ncbi:MAG: cytochrome oxidase putative small subunit CydP [Pseudomonadota bacterium]
MKRPRLPKRSLALTLTLALIVKVCLLTLLWKAFFSAPQAKKMRLPTGQVEQHLLAAPPSLPTTVSAKARHESH